MLNKTKAIVLHQIKYGDSGLIVTLYTENFGRISCLVHQSKSKKTKYPSTFFQPLSLLEVDLYYKASREIQRFKEVNLFYHYTTVPFHIAKSTVAIFLAEALYLSLREEESNPFLFSFISHALQLFDLKETNPLFHPWFLIHLSRHLGFFLEADHFDKKDSYGFNSDGLRRLSPQSFLILKNLTESIEGPPPMITLHEHRNELLEGLLRYYATHIDGFSRIKSFKILQQVFE